MYQNYVGRVKGPCRNRAGGEGPGHNEAVNHILTHTERRFIPLPALFPPVGPPVVLVIGFGPFLDVADNPAARLARAVDGRRAGHARVMGRVMPVSYHRAVTVTQALVAGSGATAVLGVGVARGRGHAALERKGRRRVDPELADVDGVCLEWLTDGGENDGGENDVEVTMDLARLRGALDVPVSDDAGAYVCNAWIYRVVRALGHTLPVGFLHVPDEGFDPDRLVGALAEMWGAEEHLG